jgi:hypothetical protein
MSVYIPNISEIAVLKSILLQRAITIGLYVNQIIPDGSTLFATLTEMTTGPTYGYAPIALENVVKESATPTAGMWTITTNSAGKASAVYAAAAQSWVFLAPDVALLPTIYGAFGWARSLPFTAASQPILPGDVLRQSAVCAQVCGVNITSGSWAAGTAAGDLYIKNQVGVFVAGATLVDASKVTSSSEIKVLTAAPVAAGTGYAEGDRFLIGTGSGGVGRVTAIVADTGAVTAVELLSGGVNYTVATHATTKIDGAGDNVLTVAVASLITSGPGVAFATLAGDSDRKLIFVESLTSPIAVTQLGQSVAYWPTLTMASG